MALKLVTPPTDTPVSLAEMKEHLRVDQSNEDTTITALIQAATAHLEGEDGWLGRALMTQTWDLQLDTFPDGSISVPLPPLQSVTSITYLDSTGASQTLDPATYRVDVVSKPGVIARLSDQWPDVQDTVGTVTIRFVAGYQDAASVPAPIKAAMKLLVGHWYENREAVTLAQIPSELPLAVQSLLASYKIWRF